MITGTTDAAPPAAARLGVVRPDGAVQRAGLPERPPDSDALVVVYQYATRRGALSPSALDGVAAELGLSAGEVFAAAARLVELHMLRTGDEGDGTLVPVDPRAAATLLISPIERAILQQREVADRLRARIDSIAGPAGAAPGPLGVIDQVEGEAEVRGLLRLAAAECGAEAAVLRPGGEVPAAEDATPVSALFDGCCGELGGGIGIRVLAPHRDRADFASRTRATRLVEGGAELRTVRAVPQAAVVFDRALAVVVDPGDGVRPPTARPVTDPAMVRCLIDMFDVLWESASPFVPDDTGYAEDIADDFQRSIAQLMSQGLTDEAVARRLGMSVRTCRRHIAALMRSLDSVSRFQAGVQLAHRLSAESVVA